MTEIRHHADRPVDRIRDRDRLAAVRATGLLDTVPEEAFDRLTRLAARVLETPYAFVTVVDDTRSFWKSCFGVESTELAHRQNLVGESFCQYVVDTDDALVVGDAAAHPLTSTNPSIDSMGVRSWAGYPIRDAGGRVLGTMCAVDTKVREWTDDDRELLRLLADAASNEMQLRTHMADVELAATELRHSLLPPVLELVPSTDVAAIHRSASGRGTVLGDFYDLFRSQRGRWHAVIGDVCGRGIEASKFTALVRWTYQATADGTDDPAEIFTAVNSVLRRQHDSRFVTAQAVSFETPVDGRLRARFASAGHHPAVIRRSDGTVEAIDANGWMLGAFQSLKTGATDVELEAGDTLVLFTDGVVEARMGNEQLGFERICEHIAHSRVGPYELTQSIVDLAEDFSDGSFHDDKAVVAIAPHAAADGGTTAA
jgi:sigma-B regulation protein RsbU (phosphoserine phosphatase)